MLGLFKSKAAKVKIDSSTAQVLELEASKKRLEIERDQIALELQNAKRRSEMVVEEQLHRHKLKLEEEKSVFNREKEIWQVDKEEIKARNERERKEFEDSLKREMELKTQEAVTLTKLDAQQKVKQSEIDKERQVNELRTKHAEELSKIKSDMAEDFYKKLTSAFQEIQLHGDKNSQFVQELTLKMFDKMPTATTKVAVDVDTNPRLVSPSKGE